MECKCNLREKLVGDGCEVCNPAKALEYAKETIADLEARLREVGDYAQGPVDVTVRPVAWMRRWAFNGEEPKKERKENGRMAWPLKFKLLPITEVRLLPDDVPLWANENRPNAK